MSRDLLFFWPLESCNYTRAGKIRFQMLADSQNANERPALNMARASAYGCGGYGYTLVQEMIGWEGWCCCLLIDLG